MSQIVRENSPLLPSDEAAQNKPIEDQTYFDRLDMIPSTRDRLSFGLVVAGIILFLPFTWYLVLSGDLDAMGWFALHPPLQSLAITAFLLGITPLQPPPPNSHTKQTRLQTHQSIILGLALPAMALGTAAMWWNKHIHGAKHFTTWHSWFGLATVGWVLLQSLIGGATVWFGGKAFGGEGQAKKVYKYHRASGYVLITLSLMTAHLGGAHSTWALGRSGMGATRVLAFWVGLPMIWLGFITRARGSKMKLL